MKKITFIAALLCGLSFSSYAAESVHAPLTSKDNAKGETTSAAATKQTRVYKEMLLCQDYNFCGKTGKACGNGTRGLAEILGLLHMQYCPGVE